MTINRNKLILISVAILVVLILLIFFFGFRDKGGDAQNGGGIFGGVFPRLAENVAPPEAPDQGFVPITENSISTLLDPGINSEFLPRWSLVALGTDPARSLATTKNSVRYHKNTPENLGHLFERATSSLDREERISNLLIQQMENVIWSPDGTAALVSYRDEELETRSFLVFYKGTSTPKTRFVDSNITSVSFSPDSKSVSYILKGANSYDIYTAPANLQGPRKVFSNTIPSLDVLWVTSKTLSLKTKASYQIENFLYRISSSGGLLNKLVGGRGIDAVWNAAGTQLIYSSVNANGRPNALVLLDTTTDVQTILPIVTFAEKCIFGKSNPKIIYCGAPKYFPAGRFPDEWWQGVVALEDTVVAYDIEKNEQLASVNTLSDIINPVIFEDDSYLFFRDKNTERVWGVKLK